MTEAEIAGYMGWRGPGAYTQHQMRKIKVIVAEVQRREREAMVEQAAKQGWAMRNEDAFEDAVREIAAIRARGQA
jgi:hypothetical protein